MPGKNTGAGCHFLLQGIFLTQGSNLGLLYPFALAAGFLPLVPPGKPYEGIDTIVGKNRQSAIVTLVEKKSKYIVLLKASRKSQDVKDATLNWLNEQVEIGIKTITFDRGKEFSRWKEIEQESKIPLEIYFSDPGAPGQRGLNENSNSIVRQDLPKSTDLSVHSQKKLNEIAMKYNRVPRRSLNYYTPEEIMKKATGLDSLLPIA